MKLNKLTFFLLFICLMAPVAFGQVKNEKRNIPKAPPPPIVAPAKKPRQDTPKVNMPDQGNDALQGDDVNDSSPRPATSTDKKRKSIPNEIGPGL